MPFRARGKDAVLVYGRGRLSSCPVECRETQCIGRDTAQSMADLANV